MVFMYFSMGACPVFSSSAYRFQFLRHLPQSNNHNLSFFGKAMVAAEQSVKKRRRGVTIMKSNNQINIPQAKAAMEQFKMQAAQEEDVFSTS